MSRILPTIAVLLLAPLPLNAEGFSLLFPDSHITPGHLLRIGAQAFDDDGLEERRPSSSLMEYADELTWGPEAGDVEISPAFSLIGDSFDAGENVSFTGQIFAGINVTPIFQVGLSAMYTNFKGRDPVQPGPPPTQSTTGATHTLLFMPTMRVHFIFDKEARFDPYVQFALGGGRIFPRGDNGGAFVFGPGGGIRTFVIPKAALDLRFEYLFVYSREDYESMRFMLGAAFLYDWLK
ncbi:MAG: outer membrane beta-barrel protein [Deltaproteobacteria bacterium]|nr:outer membrane beta-barrel protein [Deltaproteobacteria bacterium]